jgi:hypothetical protein
VLHAWQQSGLWVVGFCGSQKLLSFCRVHLVLLPVREAQIYLQLHLQFSIFMHACVYCCLMRCNAAFSTQAVLGRCCIVVGGLKMVRVVECGVVRSLDC